ncbi:MAG: plastocyanin/azurin family copper-binding protein [Chloroflexota bacterium]
MARLVPAAALVGLLLAAGLGLAPGVLAGGGCHGTDSSAHTASSAALVEMGLCSFTSTETHVARGTEIRFVNTSEVVHIVTGERQEWGSKKEMEPGTWFTWRFDADGVYPFSCPLHPGMVGAIVVGDPGGAAAAAPVADAASGSEDRAGLPTGSAGLAAASLGGALAVGLAWLLLRRRRAPSRAPVPES